MNRYKQQYAVSKNTAAIAERANHEKEHMSLTSWKNSPNGKIIQSDKNDLFLLTF